MTQSEILRCHCVDVSWEMCGQGPPCRSDQAGQQRSLLIVGELHDSRSLEFLTNPLTLLHVVDEHELHADVTAIRRLWAKIFKNFFKKTTH